MKVLIDAMRDGIDNELLKRGYEAYSIKKLLEQGEKLQSDYSIIRYSEKNNMVLVTEDMDNVEVCKENGIDHVQFAKAQTLDYLLAELEKIKIKRSPKKVFLIPKEKVVEGACHALSNAYFFRNESKSLHDKKRFLVSIPLATISLEESLKGLSLLFDQDEEGGLTKEKWIKLTKHAYKLKNMLEKEKNFFTSKPNFEESLKLTNGQSSMRTLDGAVHDITSQDELIKKLSDEQPSMLKFQTLREKCFYVDWDDFKKDWQTMNRFKENELECLSSFVLNQAEEYLSLLLFIMSQIVCYKHGEDVWKNLEFWRFFKEHPIDVLKRSSLITDVDEKIKKGHKIFNKNFND